MNTTGGVLIAVGLAIVATGAVLLLAPSIPWLGRLPGDLRYETEHTRIYVPIATCIVVSLLLSAVMWLVRLLSR